MAHTYIRFDFGADEEKAQEARHKLDVWKQAFRLDQKLQYKLERPEEDVHEDLAEGSAKAAKESDETKGGEDENVSLLVRLYFSTHEKILEKQWLERIPEEEPFKSASPKIIRKGQAGFAEAAGQFGELDKTTGRRS